MKRIFFMFISILFLSSCDDIPSDVIDVVDSNFRITRIEAPSLIVLTEETAELKISAELSNSQSVDKITAKVISIDGRFTISSSKQLNDDGMGADELAGDLKYTTSYTLTEEIPTDNYLIEFYITSFGNERKVGVKNFRYDNGTTNIAPVLSSIIAPDSLIVADTVAFAISVLVADDNGLNDIKSVYFFVTRPDGVSSGSPTFLFDDGNLLANGDETSGDGRFSRILKINESNQKGIYKLEFQAEDKGNKKSEILTHNFLVK